MRLLALTAVVMVAFAANSVLNRMAVGAGEIGAVEFAVVRLAAGAAVLLALVAVRGRGWRGASVAGVAGLAVYLFGFSLAYGQLEAGTGALVLFGVVQVTMFAGALLAGEAVPGRRWAGAALALAGLAVLVAPAGGGWAGFAAMAAAGVGWGVYSLAGRGMRWRRRRGISRWPWCRGFCWRWWWAWIWGRRRDTGWRWRCCRGR